MQQEEFGQAGRARLERRHLERAQRQRSIGARQQKHTVGLAQALLRPWAVRRVAAVKHNVVIGFETAQPFRRLFGRTCVEHAGLHAGIDERGCEPARDGFVIEPVLQRHDGECARARGVDGALGRLVQALHQDAHEVEHHARMTGDQRVERFRTDAQKFGIAQCDKLRGMRVAGNERHFADRLAREDMRDEAARAAFIVHENAKTAGDDKEQGVIVFSVAIERHSARQAEPVGFGQQAFERGVAEIRQQREFLQPLPQRLGIDGIAAGPEGR
jgi:hypothetical protein